MALAEEIVDKTWHTAYGQGHRCGYLDAVSEAWLYMKDIPAGDPRWPILADLLEFLHDRRDAVLAHVNEVPTD